MRAKFFICFIFLLTINLGLSRAQTDVEIFILPSLHTLHRANVNYSYDSLRAVIKKIDPDVIFVEIRPEDLQEDTTYLKRNYPLEMVAIPFWFRNKKVLGMDWLGKEYVGKKLPENYWKEISLIKKWEEAVEADSTIAMDLLDCEEIVAQRIPMLKSGSVQQIVNGDDEQLTIKYYQCLERVYLNTPHQRLTDFYKQRNYIMAENIAREISKNGKGKYLVVTGADHVPYIKMYLFKLGFGKAIKTINES
jgi:hypothetical protein